MSRSSESLSERLRRSRRTARSRTRSSRRPSRRPTSSSCAARRSSRRGSLLESLPKKERAILCRRFGIPEDGTDGEREPMTLQEIGEELKPLARARPPDRGAGHRAHQADDEEPGPEGVPELSPRIRRGRNAPDREACPVCKGFGVLETPEGRVVACRCRAAGPRRGAPEGRARFPSATGTAGRELRPEAPGTSRATRARAWSRASSSRNGSRRDRGLLFVGPVGVGQDAPRGRRSSQTSIEDCGVRGPLLRLLGPPRADPGDVLARRTRTAPTTSSRPTATPSSSSSTSSARAARPTGCATFSTASSTRATTASA